MAITDDVIDAVMANVDVVVSARIDAYLHHGPDATAEILARGRRYLDAGADCIYPIRLTDLAVVRTLVVELDGPVNANVAGGVAVAALAAAGASRISIGPMAFQAAYAVVDQIATDLLTPTRSPDRDQDRVRADVPARVPRPHLRDLPRRRTSRSGHRRRRDHQG